MLDFIIILSSNRDGGAKNIIPIHLLNLSKVDQFAGEVCNPRFGDVWVTMARFINVEKGNAYSILPNFIFLSL